MRKKLNLSDFSFNLVFGIICIFSFVNAHFLIHFSRLLDVSYPLLAFLAIPRTEYTRNAVRFTRTTLAPAGAAQK